MAQAYRKNPSGTGYQLFSVLRGWFDAPASFDPNKIAEVKAAEQKVEEANQQERKAAQAKGDWWAAAKTHKFGNYSGWLTDAEVEACSREWVAAVYKEKPYTADMYRAKVAPIPATPIVWQGCGGLRIRASYEKIWQIYNDLRDKYGKIAADKAYSARLAAGWTGNNALTAPDGSTGGATGYRYGPWAGPDAWKTRDQGNWYEKGGPLNPTTPDFEALDTATDGQALAGIGGRPGGTQSRFTCDGVQFESGFTVSGKSATPGAVTIMAKFPESGQYDIRVRRCTPEPADNRTLDLTNVARLVSRGQLNRKDRSAILNLHKFHTISEIEFQASQTIQGNVQQINGLCISWLRTRNDANTEWLAPRPSRNPAWVVLDILTGWSIQNHRDQPTVKNWDGGWVKDEQIDLQSFVDFAKHCEEMVPDDVNGGERYRYGFDAVLATEAPIIEIANNILSQCRAQLILNQQGKIQIMRDREQSIPRQLFTPANSWGFSGVRTFNELPHGFHVQYTSRDNGYQQATISVFRPGYDEKSARIYEDLQTFGTTNADQAAKYGMYMFAQAMMRSETFNMTVDVESLVVQRGDLVAIQHDVPMFGGIAARVTRVESVIGSFERLYLDQEFGEFPAPVGITWRDSNSNVRYVKATNQHTYGSNTIEYIRQAGVSIKVGDLIVFGTEKEADRVTERYLIKHIIPGKDFTAQVELVKYDARVYQTDDGKFPVWDPGFGPEGIEGTGLYTWKLEGSSSLKFVNSKPRSVAKLNWEIRPWKDLDTLVSIEVQYRPANGELRNLAELPANARSYEHTYEPGSDGNGPGFYTVTPINTLGFKGTSQTVFISERGDFLAPDTPRNFKGEFLTTGGTSFKWDANTEADLLNYNLLYLPYSYSPPPVLPPDPAPGDPPPIVQPPAPPPDKNSTYIAVEQHRLPVFSWSNMTTLKPALLVIDGVQTVKAPGTYRDLIGTFERADPMWIDGGAYRRTAYFSVRDTKAIRSGTTPTRIAAPMKGQTTFWLSSQNRGWYYLEAVDTSGNISPRAMVDLTVPALQAVKNFHLHLSARSSMLSWDLITDDPFVNQYGIFYNANENASATDWDNPATTFLTAVDGRTDSVAIEPKRGTYFVVAKDSFGNISPVAIDSTSFPGVAISRSGVTQSLSYIDRYPWSTAKLSWLAGGDTSNIHHYDVHWVKPDGTKELLGSPTKPEFTVKWDTVRDLDHQTGHFEITALSIYGTTSAAAQLPFTILKDVVKPPPPERFFANVVNQVIELNWLPSACVDTDRYKLKFTPKITANLDWDKAELLADTNWDTTNVTVNARTGVYGLVCVDTSGNHSDVVFQRTTVEQLPELNVVKEFREEAAGWPGQKSGFVIKGGALEMNASYRPPGEDTTAWAESTYTFKDALDLGGVYESRIVSQIEAHGIDDKGQPSEDFDCWVEYRASDSAVAIKDWVPAINAPIADPIAGSGSLNYTAWRRFYVSDITARYVQFRIVARATADNVKVVVESSHVSLDMPDTFCSGQDVGIPAGGKTITFNPEFKELKAIAVSIDGNKNPVVYEISNKTAVSFDIKLIDVTSAHHTDVSGQIDYIAQGYGRKRTTSL